MIFLISICYIIYIKHFYYKNDVTLIKKISFWDETEAKRLFQKLPFYNVLIEKPRIKHLKNIDLLHELPFYDEFINVKISQAFKIYAKSYKIEIID